MARVNIPLLNTYLRIDLNVKQVPKGEKLKKELSDFFDRHEIAGIKVKSFDIDEHFNVYPNLEGRKLSINDFQYEKELTNIGKRYCIPTLQFAISCYGK